MDPVPEADSPTAIDRDAEPAQVPEDHVLAVDPTVKAWVAPAIETKAEAKTPLFEVPNKSKGRGGAGMV